MVVTMLCALLLWGANPAADGFRADASDAKAIALADATMDAMGGRDAWDATRFVSWKFFGRRDHVWDRYTGRVRIQSEDLLILMNVQSRTGRVWQNGEEVTDPAALAPLLEQGYGWWVNDSYWVFMPYKLKDSGVALTYVGPGTTEDDRPAEVVQLDFESVGLTPNNRYQVWIDDESKLVTQWRFFSEAGDAEARFTMPWKDWRQVGRIMLCGNHGRDLDWHLAVHDALDDTVFEDPAPANLEGS